MKTNIDIEKDNLSQLATKQQSSASNPLNSVWVEASAGTGKTKVLSDRVLRLLLAKVNPAKILCLTYTKAAAVEMNERIAKRLSAWAVESDEELSHELDKLLNNDYSSTNKEQLLTFARTLFAILLDTPGGMKIQTIHSFCQDILKRFPLEAGISPYFEVMDDRRSKEILQNLKIELLRQADIDASSPLAQAITYLTQHTSEYKFPEIMNLITENRSKIDNLLLKFDNDITRIIQLLEEKLAVKISLDVEDIQRDVLSSIDKDNLKFAIDAFNQGSKEDLKRAQVFVEIATTEFSSSLYDKYKKLFLTDKGQIRASLATKAIITKFPEILSFMTNEADKILIAEQRIASLNVLKSTAAVLYIAQCIISRYREYKELYAALDYEDLIVITRRLLEDKSVADWVLFKLDGGIDHILIDEAQDTSPSQWAIVRALTQEFFAGLGSYQDALPRTVFVVGDRKQSIYSFQGADPNEFDKMYHYFNERIQDFKKVHLDVSFRSTKAIMDCVNLLFEVDTAKKGVVPDGERINHQPFRLGDGGKVEIFPLLHPEENSSKDKYNWIIPISREQNSSVSNILARQIALNIKQMVENKEILASKNRPIRYGDFMFLVQQRKSFVEEFVRACKDIGVSVAGVDKLKLLEQIAVQDLISLGKFLLLPTDDLSLAEVLKSPIFGLNDDDLFTLCFKRDGTLFKNLLKNSDYASVGEQLKSLLNLVGFVRPFELFNTVLVQLKGRSNFVARMGSEVEDVLDEFLNLAIIFEQTHTPSLESFISWILQDEVIIQKEMEQGESDTVKIMTVHGSKGLQAPIVILADTTKIKNKSRKSEFLWDKDELFYFPLSASSYDNNCNTIKNANLDADFDEYRRLLYVALTRAEDRLYIAGFTKTKDADEQSWYKLLANNLTSNVTLAEGDKRIVYTVPQENVVEVKNKTPQVVSIDVDYSTILSPAPIENPLAKPYTPSKDTVDEEEIVASPLEEQGNFYRRGTVIHKLLQYIGALKENQREFAAFEFLKKHLPDFPESEHLQIVTEVMNLCTRFPELFSANSKAEVPIIGEVDGKIISAKVDRLLVLSDKVIIVDYKTNRPAAKTLADVPEAYFTQLHSYKELVQRIYPNKLIETYLLWTNTCNMMKV